MHRLFQYLLMASLLSGCHAIYPLSASRDSSRPKPDAHEAGTDSGCSAQQEICNGLDDNCDGSIDEGGVCGSDCSGEIFQGKVYRFCTTALGHAAALTDCTAHGMTLTCVESPAEDLELQKRMAALAIDNIWLGGTDVQVEGTWIWLCDSKTFYVVEQSPPGYSGFLVNEPNNYNGNEDCLSLHLGKNGAASGWNDVPCVNSYAYVCESP